MRQTSQLKPAAAPKSVVSIRVEGGDRDLNATGRKLVETFVGYLLVRPGTSRPRRRRRDDA